MAQRLSAFNIIDAAAKKLISLLTADVAKLVVDVTYLSNRLKSQTLSNAGLAIFGVGSALAKAVNITFAVANGTLVKLAANTNMAALAGTVTNAKFNVYVFLVDSAGALTSAMGTEGASLAAVVWPTIPASKAVIGFVVINPTGTGSFVGGTTVLDDATVVPNAAYVNTQGAFDPKTAFTASSSLI